MIAANNSLSDLDIVGYADYSYSRQVAGLKVETTNTTLNNQDSLTLTALTSDSEKKESVNRTYFLPDNGNRQQSNRTDITAKQMQEVLSKNKSINSSTNASAAQSSNSGGKKLSADEEKEIKELEKIDSEVKTHENAHKAAGGGLISGATTYSYTLGPDGKQYAVGGEVKIDVSPVDGDPEATIQKMQQVRLAALAPDDPSPQDRSVASLASSVEAQARIEEQRVKADSMSQETESANQNTEKSSYTDETEKAKLNTEYTNSNNPNEEKTNIGTTEEATGGSTFINNKNNTVTNENAKSESTNALNNFMAQKASNTYQNSFSTESSAKGKKIDIYVGTGKIASLNEHKQSKKVISL